MGAIRYINCGLALVGFLFFQCTGNKGSDNSATPTEEVSEEVQLEELKPESNPVLWVNEKGGMPLRDKPDATAEILRTIPNHALVESIETTQVTDTFNKKMGTWVKVGYGSARGYLFDIYLSDMEPINDTIYIWLPEDVDGSYTAKPEEWAYATAGSVILQFFADSDEFYGQINEDGYGTSVLSGTYKKSGDTYLLNGTRNTVTYTDEESKSTATFTDYECKIYKENETLYGSCNFGPADNLIQGKVIRTRKIPNY